MKTTAFAMLLALAVPGAAASDRWTRAEAAIRRLPPSAFTELPKGIVGNLERRGCTIPQSDYRDGRHNVDRGAFTRAGRQDWAVLCSRKGRSAILVFGAAGEALPELDGAEDRHFLQGGVGDAVEYSRSIRRATRRDILAYRNAFGGPLPRRLEHDGIEASFDGKASRIFYFENGRWKS